jgi:YidC/Oxa1 family membrane protein insertase
VKKKLTLLLTLTVLVSLMSGCMDVTTPINDDSEGIWNSYFVLPLSKLILWFADAFAGSYGIAIILVTLLIRFALLPLMIKQTQSSKAMQALQPEIKALREKYSSKDAKTQQELQRETMALFQKHKVNPLAGCLPIIVQMPILIAFYHAIMRTEEIEGMFLWFSLTEPDFILPFLAGLTTFIQQKVMMRGTEGANPQMAMMLWIMPIMIIVFAFMFPAALALYWVVGNIFMIVQTYFIKGPNIDTKSENKVGGKKK